MRIATRSVWSDDGAAEVGIVTYAGRDFTAYGAFQTADYAVGYLARRAGALVLTSWDGSRVLGAARIVASWPTPHSYIASSMHQVEVTIGGRVWTGRSAGIGMIWRGKKKR